VYQTSGMLTLTDVSAAHTVADTVATFEYDGHFARSKNCFFSTN